MNPDVFRRLPFVALGAGLALCAITCSRSGGGAAEVAPPAPRSLWQVYTASFKDAKYVDLTHTLTPRSPVWKGFSPSTFGPTVNPATSAPYTYASDGFEATQYHL